MARGAEDAPGHVGYLRAFSFSSSPSSVNRLRLTTKPVAHPLFLMPIHQSPGRPQLAHCCAGPHHGGAQGGAARRATGRLRN